MASSITAISMKGRDMLFSTIAIIMNIAAMDTAFTTLKSWSVVSIMSFMQGASPISMPLGSYRLSIALRLSICPSTSSLATLYSEFTSSSSERPLFSVLTSSSGSSSSGTSAPNTLSRPRTYFTPGTFSMSFAICLTSLGGSEGSTSSMCVEATLNVLDSFSFATTYCISRGRHCPMS